MYFYNTIADKRVYVVGVIVTTNYPIPHRYQELDGIVHLISAKTNDAFFATSEC
jgi:hypothetical protein